MRQLAPHWIAVGYINRDNSANISKTHNQSKEGGYLKVWAFFLNEVEKLNIEKFVRVSREHYSAALGLSGKAQAGKPPASVQHFQEHF
jgi:hypothetical protein